jgi:hypothetical protein
MDPMYYDTISKLEEMGADSEYVQGWIGGFLHNPKREEQRITEAYEAGYEDGENRSTENAQNWLKK